jgi:urease gamma subunit
MTQLDSKTISALRTILEDVCGHLPANSTTARTFVASQMLECARRGEQTYEELRKAGREALKTAPTMWR